MAATQMCRSWFVPRDSGALFHKTAFSIRTTALLFCQLLSGTGKDIIHRLFLIQQPGKHSSLKNL
jgi:hypothetical protein